MRIRIRNPFRRSSGFQSTTRRQKLVIAALAVGTTLAIGVAMLAPHVEYLRARIALLRADRPRCADGQTEGCVGGTMGVVVVPAQAPAPASAPR